MCLLVPRLGTAAAFKKELGVGRRRLGVTTEQITVNSIRSSGAVPDSTIVDFSVAPGPKRARSGAGGLSVSYWPSRLLLVGSFWWNISVAEFHRWKVDPQPAKGHSPTLSSTRS
jgi:hypothetical protein